MRNVAIEKIGDCTGPGISCDLDTAPVRNELRIVTVEDFPCLGERHHRVRSELGLDPAAIAPLLSHPHGCNAGRHRLEDENQTARAAALSIDERLLLACTLPFLLP